MYGKMQESGLTEIIPFICISAIWGQYPVLFDIWSFLTIGSDWGLMLLHLRCSSWVPSGLTSSHSVTSVQFSHSVMPDSATPWTAARQASLSITSSWSLLKLMFIEFVMPSSHLILCHPLLLPPSVLEGCTVIADDCDILVYWYGRNNPFISHIWPVCCGSHSIIILEFGLTPWRSRLLAYVQRFSFSFFCTWKFSW